MTTEEIVWEEIDRVRKENSSLLQLVNSKDQEIERLKGLIEKAFDAHNIWTKGKDRYNDNWKAFKTENNL